MSAMNQNEGPDEFPHESSPILTREELSKVLKVSVSTVDVMVAAKEIPYMCLRGTLIRFYLPDVVRHLTATALISKRRCARRVAVGKGTETTRATEESRK